MRAVARLPGSRARPPGSGRPRTGAGRQRLPQQHADRPHVALRGRVAAVEALGGDVGERARHVADGREGVCAVELREAEVEQADREFVAILDEDVRGLDVAMDDAGAMRVRERVEDLGRDLDGIAIGERSGADRLTERPARARTRTRCRRGSRRVRRRTRGRSGRDAGAVQPSPRARRARPPCPHAG